MKFLPLLLIAGAMCAVAGELTGKGEVSGFGGGAWISDGVGIKPFYVGSVGAGVSSKALLFGDLPTRPLAIPRSIWRTRQPVLLFPVPVVAN